MGETSATPDAVGHGVSPAVRTEILESYEQRLRRTANPISTDPAMLRQAIQQARAVLDDVERYARSGTVEMAPRSTPFTLNLGRERAQRGIHPVQSLRASSLLFDAALAPLIRAYAAGSPVDGDTATNIATALHRAIMGRIETGALSYVGFLLDRVLNSHLQERRRIGRELHDRVAHAIGVSLQHLDLHRIYRERRSPRAAAKLSEADRAMRDALSLTRALSEELRHSVGRGGLEPALREYLEASVPPPVEAHLRFDGDSRAVPTSVTGEVYLVLREAIRNALLHSGTQRLDVSVEVTPTMLVARVVDHGCGFEPAPEGCSSGGLLSMRERIELLGGSVLFHLGVDGGTVVAIDVPLAGERS